MTTITITGVELTKKGFNKLRRGLSNQKVVVNRLGRAFRDDARRRITSQGGGTWEPLSKWTMARTGRRKALVTEKKNITFKVIGNRLLVGHESGGGWSLQDHEKGFTTPPDVPATIKLKRPGLLGMEGNSIHITRAKPSVTPARRVFATEAEANNLVGPIVEKWVREIIKRSKATV